MHAEFGEHGQQRVEQTAVGLAAHQAAGTLLQRHRSVGHEALIEGIATRLLHTRRHDRPDLPEPRPRTLVGPSGQP